MWTRAGSELCDRKNRRSRGHGLSRIHSPRGNVAGNRRKKACVAEPLAFLARLGVRRVRLRLGRGAVFLASPLHRHLVTLTGGIVGRFDFLKVVRRQALPFHQELHALVFVCPSLVVDAGLLQFLLPDTRLGLFGKCQCRSFLRGGRVERVLVIGRFEFRQQLAFAYVLALFDQHPRDSACHQESHIGRIRTFHRAARAYRFGALYGGWSSDLNRDRRWFRSGSGFVSARCENR